MMIARTEGPRPAVAMRLCGNRKMRAYSFSLRTCRMAIFVPFWRPPAAAQPSCPPPPACCLLVHGSSAPARCRPGDHRATRRPAERVSGQELPVDELADDLVLQPQRDDPRLLRLLRPHHRVIHRRGAAGMASVTRERTAHRRRSGRLALLLLDDVDLERACARSRLVRLPCPVSDAQSGAAFTDSGFPPAAGTVK